MGTTEKDLRAPTATDTFQPHVDLTNLRDDINDNRPRLIAFEQRTTAMTALAPQVDITELTATFDVEADRLYRFTAYVPMKVGSQAAACRVLIYDSTVPASPVLVLTPYFETPTYGAGVTRTLGGSAVLSGASAGTRSYKTTIAFFGSAASDNEVDATTSRAAYLVVEDIGPAS